MSPPAGRPRILSCIQPPALCVTVSVLLIVVRPLALAASGQDSIVHEDGTSRVDPIKLRACTASGMVRRGKEEQCCQLSLGPGGDPSPAGRKSRGASPRQLADKAARTGVVPALAASM